jgi:arginine deiminase
MQTKPGNTAQVFNEVAPLKELMVWGEPGCEALLGQLLPKTRSLFLTYYEVPRARDEFRRMQALVEHEGSRIIRAKDAFVSSLQNKRIPNLPPTLKDLERRLVQKADEYFETHRQKKVNELMNDGAGAIVEEIYYEVKKDIKVILQEDADHYGERPAIQLNYLLSLSRDLPVSNIFYSRDQSSALGDRILLSSLRWNIRRPEVEIYKEALLELGYGNILVQVEEGTIEGGDVIVFGDTCYIGVGARTSLGAVKDVCKKIGPMLEKNGIQLLAVVNERLAEEAQAFAVPTDEHMHVMHLDMFWIPLSQNLVMAYGGEIDGRKAIRISLNSGQIVTEDLGSFRKFLTDKGIEIMEVTEQEQKDYATNLLNLGNHKVVVSLSKNERVIAELQRRGYKIFQAELNKLVGGYGAIHCLTAPMRRETQ